jgi:hypothetical protein
MVNNYTILSSSPSNKLSPKSQNEISKGKSKAITLQAWTGPEGCRRLRLSDFKTIGT